MIKQFRAAASAALLGLVVAAAAPSASAAVVTGSWDPALPSNTFTNLGWTTTINLKVSDDCSAGAVSLPYIVNLFGRSFGCRSNPLRSTSAFSILSAEIGLYDLTSRLIVDVLTFRASSFTPFLLDLGPGGAITYLLSLTDSDEVRGHIAGTDNFQFRLSLPGEDPVIKWLQDGTTTGYVAGTERPTQTEFAINPDSAASAVITRTRLEIGQRVDIPEPGSMALVGLALAAAGVAASRRQRQAA